MSPERTFPIFGAAFALVYVVAEQWNIALMTYHPRINAWGPWTEAPRSGPAMYWYGWIGTALIGAVLVTLASLPLTKRRLPPAWIGWAVPFAVMALFIYLLRAFFVR
ncbi:MAG: hypothetical protein JWL62_2987 [Hyphomicrobiales bacterium]|nr:hypothetical protein [Hyphomicrobiales bacterium]